MKSASDLISCNDVNDLSFPAVCDCGCFVIGTYVWSVGSDGTVLLPVYDAYKTLGA